MKSSTTSRSILLPVLVCCLALCTGLFVVWFNDSSIPEPIEEQLTVKIIDAMIRGYKVTAGIMYSLGLTHPLSALDRYISDLFLITQLTGVPWWSYSGPDLKVTNMEMSGVQVRIYEPKSSLDQTLRPVVVYIHGGAFTMLSIDSYEPFTSRLAVDTGVMVISFNYRQSPEFPFPAARQDSMAVVRYIQQHASELRIDTSRIALAGDSCGGNLVASLTLELQRSVSMQILLVPALQAINTLTPSAVENSLYMSNSINDRGTYMVYLLYGGISIEAFPFVINNSHVTSDLQNRLSSSILNVADLVPAEIIRTYDLRPSKDQLKSASRPNVATPEEKSAEDNVMEQPWARKIAIVFTDPLFSPLMVDDSVIRQFPQTYIMTAGYDIIRDDGVMYYHRLKRLGVPSLWKHYPEAFHHALLFHSGPLKLQVGELIFKDVANYIRSHL